jgi:hypothetical protein
MSCPLTLPQTVIYNYLTYNTPCNYPADPSTNLQSCKTIAKFNFLTHRCASYSYISTRKLFKSQLKLYRFVKQKKLCVYCVELLHVMCVWENSPQQWWDEQCGLYQFVFCYLNISQPAVLTLRSRIRRFNNSNAKSTIGHDALTLRLTSPQPTTLSSILTLIPSPYSSSELSVFQQACTPTFECIVVK